jgi:hypothetical protein
MLQRDLWSLVRDGAPERSRRFTAKYVNKPLWEESLKMVAEELGELSTEASMADDVTALGRRLIESALSVDPVFAAELSRLSGRWYGKP